MGGASSTNYEINFKEENLLERDNLEDQFVVGRTVLKMILHR